MVTQVTLGSGVVSSAGSLKLQSNGTTDAVTIDGSQNVGIGTSSPLAARKLTVQGRVAVSNQSGANDSQLAFYADGTTNGIYSTYNATGSYLPMTFYTADVERMRIDSSGNLLVGTTGTIGNAKVSLKATAAGPVMFAQVAADGWYILGCNNAAGTTVGGIVMNGSTISYTGTSDYRLKENIQPMQNALAKVQQLNPVTYTWKADGSDGQGFIAHELQAVVPDCVTGEKDAVDADGNPVYQGIDTSFLVATLTAAIQEQQAMISSQAAAIQTLTQRIETLEEK